MNAKQATEDALLRLVGADEHVIARGMAGVFMLVTDRRLLWGWGTDPDRFSVIELTKIHAWAEGGENRYQVALAHEPIRRVEIVSRFHVLRFEWENMEAEIEEDVVEFRFSRRDTEGAKALRSQLLTFQVPRDERGIRRGPGTVRILRLMNLWTNGRRGRPIGPFSVVRLMPRHRHTRRPLAPEAASAEPT